MIHPFPQVPSSGPSQIAALLTTFAPRNDAFWEVDSIFSERLHLTRHCEPSANEAWQSGLVQMTRYILNDLGLRTIPPIPPHWTLPLRIRDTFPYNTTTFNTKYGTMLKKILIAFIILLILAYPGVLLYEKITYEPQDLEKLADFAKTDNLDVLIKGIQAKPVPAEGFKFVVLGDTRSNLQVAEQVMTQAASEKPAFILANGDIVRRGRVSEYISYHKRLIDSIRPVPFITVPGNHEDGPNRDFAAFLAIYGAEQFSFDYGNARHIGINNSTKWGITRAHLAYLKQELSKPGVDHKYVIFHVPPKDLGIFVDSDEGRGFRFHWKALQQLFTEEKVDHVFMGHVHGFATTVIDDVRYTITGGAGANLAEKLPEDGQVHNYVVITIKLDGVTEEVVKLKGEKWKREPIQ